MCVHCHCQMGAERNGTDVTRGHTWTCGAGRTWVVYRRVGEAMVYHCRLPAGPSTANGGCVMNGLVVRRRVTFSTGQAGRPRPPHPIDASYRIVSVAYWTRTSHRRTPVSVSAVTSRAVKPPAASPRPRGPRRWAVRAHARSTYKKLARTCVVHLLRRLYARGRPGAGGGRRAEKTHARATQGYTCDQLATADLFRTHA